MIVSVPWVTITLSALLWHTISQIFSLETKKMKTKLFILQIKILRPIIVRDILTINCTSGYHSKTWCMMLYIYFEKLIFLLHILWHAGPDPGENIRDSWRPKLETVSTDLFLINRLSWNGKRPFPSSPDCPGIELVNCSSRSNKQNHSDSSCESAYKNLKLKNLSLLNNESSFLHRTKAIQNSIFAKIWYLESSIQNVSTLDLFSHELFFPTSPTLQWILVYSWPTTNLSPFHILLSSSGSGSGTDSGSVTQAQWLRLSDSDSEPGLTLKSCRPPTTTHYPPHNFKAWRRGPTQKPKD